ncbi:hypothetical protein LIER_30532 [Lithospermum erythrorhizon]|uniref:RNase H type-1 domain-containing protein n=1 Tax=Lithospermum erythrorhizon TaxID=34254 RepID=A0AAV3RN08_LITER
MRKLIALIREYADVFAWGPEDMPGIDPKGLHTMSVMYYEGLKKVVTDQPLKRVLTSPALSGRLTTWEIELSEFEISYTPWVSIKAQALADFVIECIARAPLQVPVQREEECADPQGFEWSMHVDGAGNDKGAGAGVLITGPQEITMEYALRFAFHATNNEVEYEAMIVGLVKTSQILEYNGSIGEGDSILVIDHIQGKYGVKSEVLKKYHSKIVSLAQGFARISFRHIPR